MKHPDLSVVTATYNRKEILKMTLEHLAIQTLSPEKFEVVLVDDGSTDATDQMIREISKKLPFTLRYLTQQHKGPGAAHNYGVRSSKADIVLFLANDILASPNTLESHLKTHKLHPQSHVAVVGQLRESKDLPQTAFQKNWNPFDWVDLESKETLDELDFWISNLSIKKKFFLEYGRFYEYPEPAMEDNELAHRLFKNGLKLIYCGEALGQHHHPQTVESATQRAYTTGKNFPIFESLVPDDTKMHEFANILSPKLERKLFVKILLRDIIRLCFFNGLTVPFIVVPLIKKAETCLFLEPYIYFFTRRACGYYFRKGVFEGRKHRGSRY